MNTFSLTGHLVSSSVETLNSGDEMVKMFVRVKTGKDKFGNVEIAVFGEGRDAAAKAVAGDALFVSGQINAREWTSKQGEVKHFLNLLAFEVIKLATGQPAPTKVQPKPQPAALSIEDLKDIPF